MPIAAGGIAAITAAGAVLSQGANAYATGRMNRKNRQFSEHMYEKQRTDSLSDWDRQNKYNSPVEQMARLKAAGLNPNLVYGDGANMPSAQIKGAEFHQPKTDAPQFENPTPAVLSSYLQSSQQQQELKNMRATENLIKAQTDATLANAGLKHIDLDVKNKLHYGQDDDMSVVEAMEMDKYRKGSADAETAHQKMRSALVQAEIDEATKQDTVTAAAEKIISMRIAQTKNAAEIEVLKKKLELLKSEGILKELDVEFAQKLNKRWDGYLLKFLGIILGK